MIKLIHFLLLINFCFGDDSFRLVKDYNFRIGNDFNRDDSWLKERLNNFSIDSDSTLITFIHNTTDFCRDIDFKPPTQCTYNYFKFLIKVINKKCNYFDSNDILKVSEVFWSLDALERDNKYNYRLNTYINYLERYMDEISMLKRVSKDLQLPFFKLINSIYESILNIRFDESTFLNHFVYIERMNNGFFYWSHDDICFYNLILYFYRNLRRNFVSDNIIDRIDNSIFQITQTAINYNYYIVDKEIIKERFHVGYLRYLPEDLLVKYNNTYKIVRSKELLSNFFFIKNIT